jgi:2-polyprenyl-6-methoxyphenol hydroxylase-like FAD-dependent oxidoreductase
MGTSRSHAIAIGGSVSGLLAARVLSAHYQRVTLIERDRFPVISEQRRGVPQGRHTHGLLASGRDVLEKLFPGIGDRLIGAGAISTDIIECARWFMQGGCLARCRSGLNGILQTRPLLEGVVREEVRRLQNVEFRDNCQVEGLEATPDRASVTGVRVSGEVIPADLVVDTTGRGSDSAQWLEELGYSRPEEERVEIALAYTTRFFRRRPSQLNGDVVVIIPPTPTGKRGGVMLAQEGDRWTVTLISHFCPAAPLDLPGFIEFTRTLPAPYIHEVVHESEPVGEAASARFPHSLRRRYERLGRFPAGYLVFGDAISSFNPIYGQGMSVAALEAMELDTVLASGAAPVAPAFFQRAARVIDIPWSIAVGNDLQMPETVGPRNLGVKFINWYLTKLQRAAHHDPALAVAFHRVGNLLAPPPSLMGPANVARVLWGNVRSRRQLSATERHFQANTAQ